MVAVGYHDPKLYARRLKIFCMFAFRQPANITSSAYMMTIYPAMQKPSVRQNGRKGPRIGMDALFMGSSHHVHVAMDILLSLDIHRSNMAKVSICATQTQM